MSSEPIAFLNGAFLPYSQATLSLHNAGFVYGATISDYCRTFQQKLFRWSQHLARFLDNCTACFIPVVYPGEYLTSVAQELTAYNSRLAGPNAELALISLATPGEIGYFTGKNNSENAPTIAMHTLVLQRQRYRRFFENGIDLVPVELGIGHSPLVTVKHRSRIHWWLGDQQVRRNAHSPPGAIPINADRRLGLLDTAIGSFLLVDDGQVLCPNRSAILPSISLGVIEEICRSLSIPFAETALTIERCQQAQEAILTGTAFAVAPVRSIQQDGTIDCRYDPIGPVFEQLLKAFSSLADFDIRADFLQSP